MEEEMVVSTALPKNCWNLTVSSTAEVADPSARTPKTRVGRSRDAGMRIRHVRGGAKPDKV